MGGRYVCPNFLVEQDLSHKTAPYYFCGSPKWGENYKELKLNDIDRGSIRKHCITLEHIKCPLSSDFNKDTPEKERLRIILSELKLGNSL